MMEIDWDRDYQQFVEEVVNNQCIYTLQNNEYFFAECPSEEYDNEWGEPISVYCFWSNLVQVQACQQDEWADYICVELSLDDFMQDTLLEMDKTEKMVGVAFDEQLCGVEVDPLDLLHDLLIEIAKQNKQHEFEHYQQLLNYCEKWRDITIEQRIVH
jgi:hypothetical protein